MIVADTDVLIDFLTGTDPGATTVMDYLERGVLWITVITLFELLCGVRSTKQERTIQQLLEALPALPLDETSADLAATIRRDLRARGSDIGMADCLIAGIVMEKGGMLLTRNRRHFEEVDGLELITA